MKRILIMILVVSAVAVFFYGRPSNLQLNTDQLGYTDPAYGFSLKVPEGYEISSFRNSTSGMTFLIQNQQAEGLQLVVSPFDEDAEISESRIRNDLPEINMRNISEISIDDTRAIRFDSDYAHFGGESSNVWFIHDSHLYQLGSPIGGEDLLGQVVSGLKLP